ncbi:hypothetical protein [Paraburkholderia aromaticivorans]|uniref:hypothetical protein n=1 Tax=Paraburkholderia aromaticivorans TaxID=2026199 RepID=UPI0012FE1A71|nr:hypothetical protein [Paraburkholderia aromaticivorans]
MDAPQTALAPVTLQSGRRAAHESDTLHGETPFDDHAAKQHRAALFSVDSHLTLPDGEHLYGHPHRRAGGGSNIDNRRRADAIA